MLQKTNGAVLKTTKYNDNSIIAKIYTKQFGLQSYIIGGIYNKKSKGKSAALQPLTILDLEVIYSEKKSLHRISEINIAYQYKTIPFNIIKSSIVIFINEILYKILKEEHADEQLYDYIISSLKLLDTTEKNPANFHLMFLLGLSECLGFYPHGEFSQTTSIFDLQEGKFVSTTPLHPYYLKNELSEVLYRMMQTGIENFNTLELNNNLRKKMLDTFIEYFALHIHGFRDIKSHKVLEEIIN